MTDSEAVSSSTKEIAYQSIKMNSLDAWAVFNSSFW